MRASEGLTTSPSHGASLLMPVPQKGSSLLFSGVTINSLNYIYDSCQTIFYCRRQTHSDSVSDFSISNSVRRNSLQRQSTYKSKSSITVSVSDSDTDRPLQSDFIAQLRQVKIQSRIHSQPALAALALPRHWHYHCHCHGPWHCHWHWQGQGQGPKFEDKLSKKERVSFIRIWNTKAICHQQHYRLRTQSLQSSPLYWM